MLTIKNKDKLFVPEPWGQLNLIVDYHPQNSSFKDNNSIQELEAYHKEVEKNLSGGRRILSSLKDTFQIPWSLERRAELQSFMKKMKVKLLLRSIVPVISKLDHCINPTSSCYLTLS